MIPEQLKKMFGLTSSQDVNMANNIWKMLDEMSESDPEAYKKFVEKNINEGLGEAKVQREKKEKPYRVIPTEYCLLQMDAILAQKVIEQEPQINEKLQFNKQKWGDVKQKFPTKVRLWLNICYSDRVKVPTRKPNNTPIDNFEVSMIKDIEALYYSLQGPQQQNANIYYCMILNEKFLKAFEHVPNGRKVLLSLATSYFQQRIQGDKNPLLKKYDSYLHKKIAYFSIEKMTIEYSEHKFRFGKQKIPGDFLLQKEVDNLVRNPDKPNKKKEQTVKQPTEETKQNPIGQKKQKNPFLILPQQSQQPEKISTILPPQNIQPKKNFIEVLEEKDNTDSNTIPYQLKQTEDGYLIEFLAHGITNISQLDLEVNQKTVRLKTLKLEQNKQVQIGLKKPIDCNSAKAKMKKKSHILTVSLKFNK